ncbi:MAG: hypothetical protein IPQ13_14095 [Holophagaceae bacterium]|nr:hypothetical protein [Holophagaceae bacterium]
MAAMKAMRAVQVLLLPGMMAVSLPAQKTESVVAPAGAPQGPSAPAGEPARAQKKPPQDALPKGSALRYHVKMRMRGEDAAMETDFLLVPTPARRSNNKVQKPRLGGWRLEADRAAGTPFAQTMLLARAERLMYFSGPAPSLRPEPYGLRFGARTYPVWEVPVPANVQGFASLLEIGKNTLVLCDATVKFDTGEVATLEVHLEAFNLKPGAAPPEDGTALLSTLQQWSRAPLEGAGRLDDGITRTQNVD